MPDRMMNNRISFLIILFIAITLPAHALDPQFELDPKKLVNKQAGVPKPSEKPVKPSPPATSPKDNISRKPEIRKKTFHLEKAAKKHSSKTVAGKKGAKILGEKKGEDHGFSLFMPPPDSGRTGVENARIVWDQLYPSRNFSMEPLSIKENSYSLDLDPDIYPVIPALDRAKILINTDRKRTRL